MSTLGASLRRRWAAAAGHLRLASAVSVPVIVVTVGMSIINPYFLIDGIYRQHTGWHLFVVASSVAFAFVPLWLLLRFGHVPPRSEPAVILGVSVVAALARTVYIRGLLQPDALVFEPRDVLILTLAFVLWLPAVTMLVDSLRQEVERVNRIESLHQAVLDTRAQTAALLQQERVETLQNVTSAVASRIDQLDALPRQEAVAELRAVTHGVVRPASHQLVASVPVLEPAQVKVLDYDVKFGELTADATVTGRVPVNGLALVTLILPILYGLLTSGFGLEFAPAALGAAVLWLLGTAFNRVIADGVAGLSPRWRAVAITGEMLVMALLYAISVTLAFREPERLVRSGFLVVAVVVLAGWILLWSQSLGVRHARTAVEAAAMDRQLQWEVARANSQLRAQRRSLARILHGPVQAALNAGAIRLDSSPGEQVDPEVVAVVQQSVRKVLVDLVAGRYQERDVALALDRIRGTWAGLTQVVVHDPHGVVDQLRGDQPCASATIEIITEACSDAVRHGGAKHVEITLGRYDDLVRIVVTNDGMVDSGGESARTPGLGTSFLDALALRWTRELTNDGATLTAEVPLRG